MKLLLYTEDEFTDSSLYVNTWIDENEIKGFYIPRVDDEIPCINLFYNGDVITVVQNEELVDFLNKKFKVYAKSSSHNTSGLQ